MTQLSIEPDIISTSATHNITTHNITTATSTVSKAGTATATNSYTITPITTTIADVTATPITTAATHKQGPSNLSSSKTVNPELISNVHPSDHHSGWNSGSGSITSRNVHPNSHSGRSSSSFFESGFESKGKVQGLSEQKAHWFIDPASIQVS